MLSQHTFLRAIFQEVLYYVDTVYKDVRLLVVNKISRMRLIKINLVIYTKTKLHKSFTIGMVQSHFQLQTTIMPLSVCFVSFIEVPI